MTRPVLVWPTLILAGVGLTLLSVLVGNPARGYGLPVAWKTGGCPPPGIALTSQCLLAIGRDWLAFALDVLAYTVVEYCLLVVYIKYVRRIGLSRGRQVTYH